MFHSIVQRPWDVGVPGCRQIIPIVEIAVKDAAGASAVAVVREDRRKTHAAFKRISASRTTRF